MNESVPTYKEGHMTGNVPREKPRPFAWEKGPTGNFSKKAIRCKKTTQVQRICNKEKYTDPQTRVRKKRVERDHQHKYDPSTEKVKSKRHKGLADETKTTTPMAAAAAQPCWTP